MKKEQFDKERVFMRLMNGEACRELRDDYPFDGFLDLAVGYRWLSIREDGIRTSVPIENSMLNDDLRREELRDLAARNTGKLFRTRLYRLEDLVKRICDGTPAEDLNEGKEALDPNTIYVGTNDSGMFGAAVMLLDNEIRRIAERLGGDIYILPSSVHEVIIVPKLETYDPDMLKETVRSVNATVVSSADFLSDNVYEYDVTKGQVEMVS